MKPATAITYSPPPTVARFFASDAFVRGLMGPMGSGKSTACCVEIIRRAIEQPPGLDGRRRSRWLVARNTYPELRDTTIRTFHSWFPPELFGGKFTSNSPPRQLLRFADVELEILFTALDGPEDVRKLLSLDLTGAWLNEAREMSAEALSYLAGRVGRYPAKKDGGPGWRGIILDTNPPPVGHWWYDLFEERRPGGYEVFKQPSGLAANAENIENLPPDYYTRLLESMDEATARVMVHGEYGFVKSGHPVFEDVWEDTAHVATTPLTPLPITSGVPVVIGLDFGLTPAAVLLQKSPVGRWQVLFELVATAPTGAEQFAPLLKKLMATHFHPRQKFELFGDPAGAQKSQTDARTAYDVFRAHGLVVRPSPTQSVADRLTCVRQSLARRPEGEQAAPGLVFSPLCATLRQGMNGGYRYRERGHSNGRPLLEDTPEKNEFSHIMDALQYALAGGGEFALMRRVTGGRRPGVQLPAWEV